MFKKLKIYNEITHFSLIARRYFVNNFYDGMLTILGILLGFFMFIIYNPEITFIESILIIFPCLGTSISMFISGVSGSYLSERAEQKKEKRELDKAMVILEDEELEDINRPSELKVDEEIQKAMITPININNSIMEKNPGKGRKKTKKSRKKNRTIHEKAERFTNVIVSFTNGTAPLLGGLVPSIPFFFIQNAGIATFLISFLIILICIVFLGIMLGVISKESVLKNILEMVAAFIVTLLISFLLLRV
ncbi:MAG: VIT1/CCC1 transporter family protein [Promethearchaeota archaeon]|jgi:predicted membrane protein (TIGR00267 family)